MRSEGSRTCYLTSLKPKSPRIRGLRAKGCPGYSRLICWAIPCVLGPTTGGPQPALGCAAALRHARTLGRRLGCRGQHAGSKKNIVFLVSLYIYIYMCVCIHALIYAFPAVASDTAITLWNDFGDHSGLGIGQGTWNFHYTALLSWSLLLSLLLSRSPLRSKEESYPERFRQNWKEYQFPFGA